MDYFSWLFFGHTVMKQGKTLKIGFILVFIFLSVLVLLSSTNKQPPPPQKKKRKERLGCCGALGHHITLNLPNPNQNSTFAFLHFSLHPPRTRANNSKKLKHGEFHSDPGCTDPVENFPDITYESRADL